MTKDNQRLHHTPSQVTSPKGKHFSGMYPYAIWFIPLSFFFLQFILRVFPGVLMNEIMGQLKTNAAGFGMINTAYYCGYAGMQIPTALLLDWWGLRKTVTTFVILCATSTLAFFFTENLMMAIIARFLVGAGSSVAILATCKVISDYFPQKRYASMLGLSIFVGLVGAIFGSDQLKTLVDVYSWQSVAMGLVLVTFIPGVLGFFFLKDHATSEVMQDFLRENQALQGEAIDKKKKISKKSPLNVLLQVVKSPILWSVSIVSLLMVGVLEGFADAWGVSYLTTSLKLDVKTARSLVPSIFFGVMIAGLVTPWFNKRLGEGLATVLYGIGLTLGFSWILFAPYDYHIFMIFLFMGGLFSGGYQNALLSLGARLASRETQSLSVAFINCINMLGGSYFHSLIGFVISQSWTGDFLPDQVTPCYSGAAYKKALLCIPVSAALGVMIMLWVLPLLKRANQETDSSH